jgi:hypothetical protein
MKVILADPAKEELENGTTYYELEQKGLGEIFEEEVKTGINLENSCSFIFHLPGRTIPLGFSGLTLKLFMTQKN